MLSRNLRMNFRVGGIHLVKGFFKIAALREGIRIFRINLWPNKFCDPCTKVPSFLMSKLPPLPKITPFVHGRRNNEHLCVYLSGRTLVYCLFLPAFPIFRPPEVGIWGRNCKVALVLIFDSPFSFLSHTWRNVLLLRLALGSNFYINSIYSCASWNITQNDQQFSKFTVQNRTIIFARIFLLYYCRHKIRKMCRMARVFCGL